MRTLDVRFGVMRAVGLLALTLACGCELVTEGTHRADPTEREDASVADAHTLDSGAVDAGDAARPLDATPPALSCSPACASGSHCVVSANSASCVVDSTPPPKDASTPPQDASMPPVDASIPPPTCTPACSAGSQCVVSGQSASCVQDPPPPVDASVPPVDASTTTPCGSNTCSADQICCDSSCGVCGAKGGVCPAISCVADAGPPPATCDDTACPADEYCDDSTGVPVCTPNPSCADVQCQAGYTCELVKVTCVRAPCPPIPECVANPLPTCDPPCMVGMHCVVSTTSASCQPDGNCGKNSCGPGQICCSAGCGVCGAKGGACPAIACPLEQ